MATTVRKAPQNNTSGRSCDSDVAEDARVGYQVATSLWTYEGNLIWARFNTMLLVNSVVIAAIGVLIGIGEEPDWIILLIPLFGLITCALWWTSMARGFDYYSYWIHSARELEELLPSAFTRTVSRGSDFANGKSVKFQFKAGEKSHKLTFTGRIRIQYVAKGFILMFATIYVIFFIWLLDFGGVPMENGQISSWETVGMTIGIMALIAAGIGILLSYKFHNDDQIAREDHENAEEKRFAATASTLEEIRDAVKKGSLVTQSDLVRVDEAWTNFVSVAQSTGSDWRPEMAKVYTPKMRAQTITDSDRDSNAGSDGPPPEEQQ